MEQNLMISRRKRQGISLAVLLLCLGSGGLTRSLHAQSVGLPLPRLLNVYPMGGQAGTSFEVTITGENLDLCEQLLFSDPRITARTAKDENDLPIPNRFIVSIGEDCSVSLVEARAVARLGVSSPRLFSISQYPETTLLADHTSPDIAVDIRLDSVVNATAAPRAVNYYRFSASAGQRVLIECVSRGIDSKMDPVVSLTDSHGRNLATQRFGESIDCRLEEDGVYIIKVHDLTYNGGPDYFYRLVVHGLAGPEAAFPQPHPTSREVAQYSWPPEGFDSQDSVSEVESNGLDRPQLIQLPCQIYGSFFPAADVDCYQFEAKKGEQWWIEIASHRLGRPTDPSLLVQRLLPTEQSDETDEAAAQNSLPPSKGAIQNSEVEVASGRRQQWQDVLELHDISSPVRVSTNFYSYDGPPYNGSSTDFHGLLEIPADGVYRLVLTDLFGGTRNDMRNQYYLAIRPAMPDFALVAWAIHRELRNGDRAALSKPLALRPGSTVALEVMAFRRDGFDGAISLDVEGLPDGVSAQSIDIPPGKSSGVILFTAEDDATEQLALNVEIIGRSEWAGQTLTRPCQKACMAWPVRDHWQEFPRPRLLQTIALSVTEAEASPMTITLRSSADEDNGAPANVDKDNSGVTDGRGERTSVVRAKADQAVQIPLQLIRRCEHSGGSLSLRTFGAGFEAAPPIEIPLQSDEAEVTINLAPLNLQPGVYPVAFYGGVVAKYRDYPEGVLAAEATGDSAAIQAATSRSQPTDIADIVVSKPFFIEIVSEEN